MAHKKSLLNKFFTDHEDTNDSASSRSPVHDGRTWIIPETTHSSQTDFDQTQKQHGQNYNTTSSK